MNLNKMNPGFQSAPVAAQIGMGASPGFMANPAVAVEIGNNQ